VLFSYGHKATTAALCALPPLIDQPLTANLFKSSKPLIGDDALLFSCF